jgi:hypothetical protein
VIFNSGGAGCESGRDAAAASQRVAAPIVRVRTTSLRLCVGASPISARRIVLFRESSDPF